jgi:hypothetical protein
MYENQTVSSFHGFHPIPGNRETSDLFMETTGETGWKTKT